MEFGAPLKIWWWNCSLSQHYPGLCISTGMARIHSSDQLWLLLQAVYYCLVNNVCTNKLWSRELVSVNFCVELYSLHSILIDKSTYMTFMLILGVGMKHQLGCLTHNNQLSGPMLYRISYWSSAERFGVYNKGERTRLWQYSLPLVVVTSIVIILSAALYLLLRLGILAHWRCFTKYSYGFITMSFISTPHLNSNILCKLY